MTNYAETYAQIVSLTSSLRVEAEPFAKRFLNFITNTNTHGYLDFTLPDGGDPLPFEGYEMKVLYADSSEAVEGIAYIGEIWEWEDSVEVSFMMPFEYMADPEKWEKDLIERATRNRNDAIEAFKKLAPGFIDGNEDKIIVDGSLYLGTLALIAFDFSQMVGGWDASVSYKGKEYQAYHGFCFKPETGEIFLATVHDLSSIRDGSAKALTFEDF